MQNEVDSAGRSTRGHMKVLPAFQEDQRIWIIFKGKASEEQTFVNLTVSVLLGMDWKEDNLDKAQCVDCCSKPEG